MSESASSCNILKYVKVYKKHCSGNQIHLLGITLECSDYLISQQPLSIWYYLSCYRDFHDKTNRLRPFIFLIELTYWECAIIKLIWPPQLNLESYWLILIKYRREIVAYKMTISVSEGPSKPSKLMLPYMYLGQGSLNSCRFSNKDYRQTILPTKSWCIALLDRLWP